MLTDFQNSFTITLFSKFAVEVNKYPTIIYTSPYTTMQNFCAKNRKLHCPEKGATRFIRIILIILHLIS